MTRSAVLPNKMCARPVLPLVPTTMRSESSPILPSRRGNYLFARNARGHPSRDRNASPFRTAFEVDQLRRCALE